MSESRSTTVPELGNHVPFTEHGARSTETPFATQTGAAAPNGEKTPSGRGTAREIVGAVMSYCRAHSIPDPDRLARSAFGQQTRNLLAGGYDEADIRSTALDLAAKYTQYTRHKALMTLQNTVTQNCVDRAVKEHEKIIKDSKHFAPGVAAAMGMPIQGFPGARSSFDPDWSRRCSAHGCGRTSLYGIRECADHEKSA